MSVVPEHVAQTNGHGGARAADGRASAPERGPALPAAAEKANAGLWRALSALRGARTVHPKGVAYRGTFTVRAGGPRHGAALLDEPAEHEAVVRFSRSLGVPHPLPDLLGITVRIVDAHGPGHHQDVPMVTSVDAPVLHHLLLPAVAGWFGQSYTSGLVYDLGGRTGLIGALPRHPPGPAGRRGTIEELERVRATGPLRFGLATAGLTGRWRTAGELRLDERLPDADTEALAFNPWHTGDDVRPTGPFMGLRRSAYRASQIGRGLRP